MKESISKFEKDMVKLLKADKWKEPTKKQYPTYLQAYKKHGQRAKAPYFEDVHYIWKLYKQN